VELMLLRVFQRQVVDQCRFAISGVPLINQTGNSDQMWIGCQMFVVGAANISKALWGEGRGRSKIAPRRQPLRDSLEVTEDSPLKEVGMRHNFEHYDQRLDQWWSQSPSHNHLDRSEFAPGAVVGIRNIDMFRVYDRSARTLYFWGQPFELQPIADEIDRIFPIAVREAAKPHWEPPTSTLGNGQ
jgi:hypothetical protein